MRYVLCIVMLALSFAMSVPAMESSSLHEQNVLHDSTNKSPDDQVFDDVVTIAPQHMWHILNYKLPASWKTGQQHCSFLLFPVLGDTFDAEDSLAVPEDSDFRYYVPPLFYAQFINQRLTASPYRIIAAGADMLTENNLIAIIEKSIADGKPLSMYIADVDKLSLITVFGISKSDTHKEVLVIQGWTTKKKFERITVKQLHTLMDLTSWISMLDRMVFLIKYGYTRSQIANFVSEFLLQIKPFTILQYERMLPKPPEGLGEDESNGEEKQSEVVAPIVTKPYVEQNCIMM